MNYESIQNQFRKRPEIATIDKSDDSMTSYFKGKINELHTYEVNLYVGLDYALRRYAFYYKMINWYLDEMRASFNFHDLNELEHYTSANREIKDFMPRLQTILDLLQSFGFKGYQTLWEAYCRLNWKYTKALSRRK